MIPTGIPGWVPMQTDEAASQIGPTRVGTGKKKKKDPLKALTKTLTEQANNQAEQQRQEAEAAAAAAAQAHAEATEAERLRNEQQTAAQAPRWVRSRPSYFGGQNGGEVVTLPNGQQVTRSEAYQRGWRSTTTPGDEGVGAAELATPETVYVDADPANDAATRQAISQNGGQITASYGGRYQVSIPVGAIGALRSVPGLNLSQGRYASATAGSYLPAGYSEAGMGAGSGANATTPDTSGPYSDYSNDTPDYTPSGAFDRTQPSYKNPMSAMMAGQTLGNSLQQGLGVPQTAGDYRPEAPNQGPSDTINNTPVTQGGYGEYAPFVNAPPTPTWEQWQSMSPFEKASWRILAQSAKPWEQAQQDLRNKWATSGVTQTPASTQLSAAMNTPRDTLGQNFTAEAFGEKPEDYWAGQQKIWDTSQMGSGAINTGRSRKNRQAVLGL